MSVLLKEFLDN